MAMFDLKDSEDIKLTACHTDSPTLLKGERINRLEVADSSAFTPHSGLPAAPRRSILRILSKHLLATFLTIASGLFVAYLGWRFGWTK